MCCVVRILQLPAGVIEQGETVEHLAERELKEETGVLVWLLGVLCLRIRREGACFEFTSLLVARNSDRFLWEERHHPVAIA